MVLEMISCMTLVSGLVLGRSASARASRRGHQLLTEVLFNEINWETLILIFLQIRPRKWNLSCENVLELVGLPPSL